MSNKIVVFSPHPDDETLGCSGTIVKKLEEGYEVIVVVMTDGQHSHDHVLGINDPPPAVIKTIRREEFKKAMQILGVKENNIVMLDFEDGELDKHLKAAEEKIKKILSKIKPDEVYVTYRADEKKDHEFTYKIVSESLEQVDMSPITYEYPIWSRKRDIAQYSQKNLCIKDITGQLSTKKAAISKYKSQISKISPEQKEPILQKTFIDMFLQKEVFFKTMSK
jgi:LmbE family N-acetylglucosaminyl deacetylase